METFRNAKAYFNVWWRNLKACWCEEEEDDIIIDYRNQGQALHFREQRETGVSTSHSYPQLSQRTYVNESRPPTRYVWVPKPPPRPRRYMQRPRPYINLEQRSQILKLQREADKLKEPPVLVVKRNEQKVVICEPAPQSTARAEIHQAPTQTKKPQPIRELKVENVPEPNLGPKPTRYIYLERRARILQQQKEGEKIIKAQRALCKNADNISTLEPQPSTSAAGMPPFTPASELDLEDVNEAPVFEKVVFKKNKKAFHHLYNETKTIGKAK